MTDRLPLVIITGNTQNLPAGDTLPQSIINGLSTSFAAKLDSTSYTAADVLAKLITVGGAASGLDADKLDGQHGAFYLNFGNMTGKPTTLSGYGITDAQPLATLLTAFAGLGAAANKLAYFNGTTTMAVTDFTSQAITLLGQTSFSAMRTTLGLVIGTDVQAHSAILDNVAGLDSSLGLVEQTAATTFAKRAIGVGASTSVPTRADADARYLQLAGGQAMTGLFTLSGDATSALHPVTKQQLDAAVSGSTWKPDALVASTGTNITLSGEQTIDGQLTSASYVLVKDNTAPSENGLWLTGAGTWTRALEMDAWTEVPGATIKIEKGTQNGDTIWLCTSDKGGTLGTTAITFTQIPTVGSFTATNGIILSGNQFSLTGQAAAFHNLGSNGIVVRTASGTVAARTLQAPAAGFSVTNGDGVAGNPTFTLTNDLAALEGLSSNGYAKRTGTDTWSSVSAIPEADISGLVADLLDRASQSAGADFTSSSLLVATRSASDGSTHAASTAYVDNAVSANAASISAIVSGTLAVGDGVNLFNNSGTINARKCDGSTSGKSADGYVNSAYTAGQTAVVLVGGVNLNASGLTVGANVFISPTTPGGVTTTAPTTSGQVVQRIGKALTSASYLFQYSPPIQL